MVIYLYMIHSILVILFKPSHHEFVFTPSSMSNETAQINDFCTNRNVQAEFNNFKYKCI